MCFSWIFIFCELLLIGGQGSGVGNGFQGFFYYCIFYILYFVVVFVFEELFGNVGFEYVFGGVFDGFVQCICGKGIVMFFSVSDQALQQGIINVEGGNKVVQFLFCQCSGVCFFVQVVENVLWYVLLECQVVFVQVEGIDGYKYIGYNVIIVVDDLFVVGVVFGGVLYQDILGCFYFFGFVLVIYFVFVGFGVIVGFLDGMAGGCIVLGNGKVQCGFVVEFVLFLYQFFFKRMLANNDVLVVVLNCFCYDFIG